MRIAKASAHFATAHSGKNTCMHCGASKEPSSRSHRSRRVGLAFLLWGAMAMGMLCIEVGVVIWQCSSWFCLLLGESMAMYLSCIKVGVAIWLWVTLVWIIVHCLVSEVLTL